MKRKKIIAVMLLIIGLLFIGFGTHIIVNQNNKSELKVNDTNKKEDIKINYNYFGKYKNQEISYLYINNDSSKYKELGKLVEKYNLLDSSYSVPNLTSLTTDQYSIIDNYKKWFIYNLLIRQGNYTKLTCLDNVVTKEDAVNENDTKNGKCPDSNIVKFVTYNQMNNLYKQYFFEELEKDGGMFTLHEIFYSKNLDGFAELEGASGDYSEPILYNYYIYSYKENEQFLYINIYEDNLIIDTMNDNGYPMCTRTDTKKCYNTDYSYEEIANDRINNFKDSFKSYTVKFKKAKNDYILQDVI